jgi:hypothetical protein
VSGIAWSPERAPDDRMCQYWATRTTVETDMVHAMMWYGPKGSPIWIGQCMWCGWVDGAELADQIARYDAERGWGDTTALRAQLADVSDAHHEGFGAGVEWADERAALREERDRLKTLIRSIRFLGIGFVWRRPNGEELVINPAEITLVMSADEPTTVHDLRAQLAAYEDVVAKAWAWRARMASAIFHGSCYSEDLDLSDALDALPPQGTSGD